MLRRHRRSSLDVGEADTKPSRLKHKNFKDKGEELKLLHADLTH